MKIGTILILSLAFTSGYAAAIYKSMDRDGNVVFSDHPILAAQQVEKLAIAEPSAQQEKQAQQQLKQLRQEDKAIHRQLAEQQKQRDTAQRKLGQAYDNLDIAKRAQQIAEGNWQDAVKELNKSNTDYNKKRALLLEKAYEQAKANYFKAEKELVKAQNELNSLK